VLPRILLRDAHRFEGLCFVAADVHAQHLCVAHGVDHPEVGFNRNAAFDTHSALVNAHDHMAFICVIELLSGQLELSEPVDSVGQHLHHSLASVVRHDVGHGSRRADGNEVLSTSASAAENDLGHSRTATRNHLLATVDAVVASLKENTA